MRRLCRHEHNSRDSLNDSSGVARLFGRDVQCHPLPFENVVSSIEHYAALTTFAPGIRSCYPRKLANCTTFQYLPSSFIFGWLCARLISSTVSFDLLPLYSLPPSPLIRRSINQPQCSSACVALFDNKLAAFSITQVEINYLSILSDFI